MPEKLCIFCVHFSWGSREIYGSGSEMTGPMCEGGDAACSKGHYKDNPYPSDEAEYRAVILRGEKCPDYKQVLRYYDLKDAP